MAPPARAWRKLRGCGCRQRSAPQAAVCPISGKGSSTGVCPISGQGLPGQAPLGGRDAAPAEPPAPQAEAAGQSAKARFEDSLMGAATQADAETAQELKAQGNEKFKGKLYEEALGFYNEALQLQPREPTIWLNRSIVNRHLGNWEDAQDDAELAAGMQPDNAKAHYSMALCLQQAGKLQTALVSCRAGLKVQPDNKALAQLLNVVKRQIAELDRGGAPPVNPAPAKAPQAPAAPADGPEEAAALRRSPRRKPKAPASPSAEAQQQVDPNSCPVSRLKENELEDIKRQAMASMYSWKNGKPSHEEREAVKRMLTDSFRQKYSELKVQSRAASLDTSQYDKLQKQGLQLKGGHQHMKRPDHVDLPAKFQEPMGVITIDELKKYSWENPDRRYLISVYGNVFDVSDRPDKYGPDGPYTILTGADITWGLFAGVDTEDYVNRCYDLFKAKDMGKDKIAGVCSWLAWYWTEYGDPVAQLEPFVREGDLPAPPLEEVDESCCVM